MKMVILESPSKEDFIIKVNEFLRDRDVFSVKFQRNLYYSLSGSTCLPGEAFRETSSLKESYIAFVVYR